MKKTLKISMFFVGCLIICILAIASNSRWSENLSDHLPNVYRYGDLFLFSNMPAFKIPVDMKKINMSCKTKNENVKLTIVGDSYMLRFDSTSFCTQQYQFVHWDKTPAAISPRDPRQTNILIITTGERYCRWRLKNTNPLFIDQPQTTVSEPAKIKLGAEDNLQYILTNLDWAIPFKELKTFIYLKLFNKFDNRVAKPDNSGRLFLEETIDPSKSSSCYNPVSDTEVNELVDSINAMYSHVKKLGFDKVYFSIIPNAASLYHASELPYNHIIERIQSNSELMVPYIDAYHLLKKQTESVFYTSDSHWNREGKMLWLQQVDTLIRN